MFKNKNIVLNSGSHGVHSDKSDLLIRGFYFWNPFSDSYVNITLGLRAFYV